MPRRVVEPDELTALSLRLAEAYGAARGIRTRLEEAEDGPLATLAAMRMQALEDVLGTCVEGLGPLHELLVLVTVDDEGATP